MKIYDVRIVVFLTLLVLLPYAESDAANPRTRVSVADCLVSFVDDVDVPSQRAGVLLSLRVRDGSPVRKGDVLALIDDKEAVVDRRRAELEHASAKEQADDDINIRFAKASADVAHAEYQAAIVAVKEVPGSIAPIEVLRLELAHRRAVLQIEQAQMEQRVLKNTAHIRAAEIEIATEAIRRHKIHSPTDGVVEKTVRNVGEWVSPGDMLMRIVRMDKLKIEGFVSDATISPHDLVGRPMTAKVERGGGKVEQFKGTVIFVSTEKQATGSYRIWAEVENRRKAGKWLLYPGQSATMNLK